MQRAVSTLLLYEAQLHSILYIIVVVYCHVLCLEISRTHQASDGGWEYIKNFMICNILAFVPLARFHFETIFAQNLQGGFFYAFFDRREFIILLIKFCKSMP